MTLLSESRSSNGPSTGGAAASDPSLTAPANPLYFGTPGRELFGMLHPGAAVSGRRTAVLLCSPFGLEAIRAHRTFRVLAERLARAGHTVLRFDYYGSGDSDGEETDVTLAGWRDDIETASVKLQAVAPGLPLAWIGLGLGATVALLATRHTSQPPSRLLLWEPVIDGRGYLATLRRRHAALVEVAGAPTAPEDLEQARGFEALGFAVSPALEAEIAAIASASLPTPPAATRTTLVAQPDDLLARSLVERCQTTGPQFDRVEQSHTVDWMSETADAGTLVPGPALIKLAALVRST